MNLFIVIYYFVSVFGFIQLFSVFNYGLTINDIFLFILAFIFVKDSIWKGKVLETAKNPAVIFFLLQIAFVLISALVPLFKGDKIQIIQYLKTTSHFLLYTVIMFIAFTYKIENKIWVRIIKIFIISSIFINLFGIYQLFARIYDLPLAFFEYNSFSSQLRNADTDNTLKQATLKLENFYRATSIFPEPAGLAGFNLLIFSLVFFPLIHRLKTFFRSKLFNYTVLSLTLVTLLLTYSLTAASVLFFLIIAFFVLTGFQYIIKLWKYLLISFILLVVADIVIQQYVEISVLNMFWERISKILTTFDPNKYAVAESLPQRLRSAGVAIEVWSSSPLIGVGVGLLAFNTATDIMFADSTFFMVLSQAGILGALAFTLMFAVLIYKTYKYAGMYMNSKTDDYEATLYVLTYYIIVYLLIINFFIANNYVNPGMWSYLAIVFALINKDLINKNFKIYRIRFFEKPLEFKFNTRVAEYLKTNIGRKEI
jgi:hypothetical protein